MIIKNKSRFVFFIIVFFVTILYSEKIDGDPYVPPSAWEMETYKAYDIPIPKERQKDCIQKMEYNISYDKHTVKKAYEKWIKNNTGTYVYIYGTLNRLGHGVILFIKNNNLQKSIYENCYDEHHGFPFQLQECKYDLKHIKNKEKTANILRNTKYHLIKDRFISARDRDLSRNQYCIQLEWKLTYHKKYGYISYVEAKKPHCKCMPIPLHENHYFIYGLLMLPKDTKYTQDVIAKILRLYDKANTCEQEVLASKQTDASDANLTALEKAVGKEKLECLDKYLVWDENGTK